MITLEKIDQVVERTGVTYEIARDALNACEGDVIDAIIFLEKTQGEQPIKEKATSIADNINLKASELMDTVKELIRKGNVSSVIIEKNGKVVLNLPVTISAVGFIFGPVAGIIGVGAAIVQDYVIKIEKEDGEIIDVNALTTKKLDEIKQKVNETVDRLHPSEKEESPNTEENTAEEMETDSNSQEESK